MGICFIGGCAARADDAYITMPLDEADHEQTGRGIVADDDLSLLGVRVIWVREDARVWIEEHRNGIGKLNAMLACVDRSLSLIPFELHADSLIAKIGGV